MEDKFLTAKELADILKVNVMTIYRYIKKGRIKAYKIGNDIRIKNDDFERFLSETRVSPPSKLTNYEL
jgi:excisionase family DNA binding protein